MHSAKKLTFVLVQTLDLYIHHGIRVEKNVVIAFGKSGEAPFVFRFDFQHTKADIFITGIFRKADQLFSICKVGIGTKQFTDQLVEAGVIC